MANTTPPAVARALIPPAWRTPLFAWALVLPALALLVGLVAYPFFYAIYVSFTNRVIGNDPSQILGRLTANGRVYLINPNGILFGSGAQVNVGGLVASTLDIDDDSLSNNRRRFAGNSKASVVVAAERSRPRAPRMSRTRWLAHEFRH